VPTRLSTLFLRTLRDDPADAEVPSHRLLVRAGYIRRVAPGIYSWLPLGLAVLRNIERVVRDEMLAIGAQEVQLSSLIPKEVFEQSGRLAHYGAALFRLSDRRNADYLLGPTHEELFTLLVAGESSSHRDLPVTLFQIQTKFRDEARPRAGVLRGREFVMKDSYSFDLDDAGLAVSYQAHRDAYERIFRRLGLDYRIVRAVSGAMGGSASEEFLAPTPVGEDTFVHCSACDYAANTEAAEIAAPLAGDSTAGAPGLLETPGASTIAALVEALNERRPERRWTAADTLKCVVVKTRAPGATIFELLVVGVPGDRDVDLRRLAGQLDAEVEPATGEDLAADGRLLRGYLGPQGLTELGVRLVVDPLVAPGTVWVAGANEADRHVVGLVAGRDFSADATLGAVDIRQGDPCPRCGAGLEVARGIELGHVFQLGRKYADAFGLDVLGPDGKPVRVAMGSYGIGVSRAVGAIAEQTHDEHGLRWPRAVSPAEVHVVVARKGDEAEAVAARLADELEVGGIRVVLDDRPGLSPGVRFADADLIGVPLLVTIGRGLPDGTIEVRDRWTGQRRDVALERASAGIAEALAPLP
jgi:prolyl-tRNA synthetase